MPVRKGREAEPQKKKKHIERIERVNQDNTRRSKATDTNTSVLKHQNIRRRTSAPNLKRTKPFQMLELLLHRKEKVCEMNPQFPKQVDD